YDWQQLVVVLVVILSEGCVKREPTSVLQNWLFSSPNHVPHSGRGLARSGLFRIALGEYFRRTQLYPGPTDGVNLLVQKMLWVGKMDLVDDFDCPARFPWHTAKNVTRDPTLAAANFNAQDYATLVAHPSPFQKFPEEFMCLVELSRHYTLDEETYPLFLDKDGEDMDLFAFIHTPDPTKVKVVERERKENEPRLLETTVGRTVPLLPVSPDRGESDLEASVDKLFDEGGRGNQAEEGDSTGGGGGVNIQPTVEAANIVIEDVAPVQPKRQRKRKIMAVDTGESSHPPKKLRDD
ncbi:hypothetical protein Tco_1442564, partial [Tanacetum coccineum]